MAYGQPPQPFQPPVQSGQNQPQSMNLHVSSEKRGALKDYMEGYKAAIESKTMNTMNNLLPNISSPQPPMGQPPMMPQGQGMGMPQMPPQGMMPQQQGMMPPQPPMMMNMGGSVDVFDPVHMREGGTIIQTDDTGRISTRPVFDEDRGRMVSQIISRDEANAMKQSALGGGLANVIRQKEEDKVIEDVILNNIIADDSLKSVPDYTTTNVEPETSDIGLPTPKPTTEDFLYDVTNTDEMSRFADIPLPISKFVPMDSDMFDQDTGQYINFLDKMQKKLPTDRADLFPNTPPSGLIPKSMEVDTGEFNRFGGGVERQALIDKPVEGIYDEATGEYTFKPIDVVDPFILERELAKRRLSPEGMDQIGRMVLEGEKLSGPEVPVFDMPNYDVGIDDVFAPAQTGVAGSGSPVVAQYPTKDRQPEISLEDIMQQISSSAQPMTSSGEEEGKLSGLMELLKMNPQLFPMLKLLNESDKSGLMGGMLGLSLSPSLRAKAEDYGSNFNTGGIVQGFRNGGFTTNLKTRDLTPKEKETARDAENVARRLKIMQPDLFTRSTLATGAGSKYGSGYGTNLQTELDESGIYEPSGDIDNLGSATPIFDPIPNIDAGERAASYMLPQPVFTGDQFDDSNIDEMAALPVTPFTPITQPEATRYTAGQGAPDNTFGFNQFTRPIIDFMGYDTSTPAGAGQYYADTQASVLRNEADERERGRQQDREQRKLAEEQRLRDMISGMLPEAEVAGDPAPPIAAPTDPVEETAPDYSSVVVPSDRIPNFDVNQISPYPQFNMPVIPQRQQLPILPSGISPELLRNLFKMQGVPAATMNQGGSVNTLDTAVDNFLGSLRSVA